MLCANCHRLTHDARASRVADDPNAPLSVPHAHAEHQREVRLVQHHLMRARCAHGIGGSGACNITTDMNDDGRCPPPLGAMWRLPRRYRPFLRSCGRIASYIYMYFCSWPLFLHVSSMGSDLHRPPQPIDAFCWRRHRYVCVSSNASWPLCS